jgi:tetratricopeptide (TPR) repeat protein
MSGEFDGDDFDDGEVTGQALVARELRRHRERAGLSRNQLANRVGYSRTYVSNCEKPSSPLISEAVVRRIDEELDAGGLLIALHAQANSERKSLQGRVEVVPDPPDLPVDDEMNDASTRRAFLKTLSGVAVSALTGDFDDNLTSARDDKPLEYYTRARRALVDNDNIFGPRSVIPLAEQQITSISRSCRDAQGSDRIALLEVRAHFAELIAWLHQDLGNYPIAKYWLDRALDWSYAHGQPELPSFILARKSQLACDMRDCSIGIGIGELAVKSAPTPLLAAIASTYTAHSYAVRGSSAESERLYESARELASDARDGDGSGSGLGAWLDESYIDVHRAGSLYEFGHHEAAAEIFMDAIGRLAPGFHRDRGVYLARAANAYASAGDGASAVDAGSQALRIALDTGSGRTMTQLDQLSTQLATESNPAAVTFRTAISDAVKDAAHLPAH